MIFQSKMLLLRKFFVLVSADSIALSFIKPCCSKVACSPPKIAEYLANCVSIIINRAGGDVAEAVESQYIGVVLENFGADKVS